MLRMRFAVCLVCILAYAVDARPQVRRANIVRRTSITARSLDIKIGGFACKPGSEVWVVMDGKENGAFKATPDADGTCHWTAKDLTFDTAFSRFSLRLGSARTACVYADADRQNKLGNLRFDRFRTEARQMTLTAEPRIPVSYTREVPDNSDGRETPGCMELYSFSEYPIEVRSVWFPDEALYPDKRQAIIGSPDDLPPAEILRVQLNRKEADPTAPGLIINDISVTRRLKKGPTLDVEKMRAALREQRSKGQSSMSAVIPPNADEEVLASAIKKGLTSITIDLVK